jgi:hypothetical protein
MRTQSTLLVAAWLLIPTATSGGSTLSVKPTESLSAVREKLAADASITEAIFAEGVYFGGLSVEGPKGTDFAQHPLLIRAADGAHVVFDGARPVENFRPHEELPGVFWIDYTSHGGECPKTWEPGTRIRYRLVADRQAVVRFPATYSIESKRLLFHTSDGKAPRSGDLLMSVQDCGLFVNRPHVTVRGIAFRNSLAREKWSSGIDLRVAHIVAEDCRSSNCSLGFIVTGNNNVVRRCTAEDVGGGVYVGGESASVEGCRLHKQRDSFMVPVYAQDDTGIQYYSPARGGVIRGNLCEGFGMGVFIKAGNAPYVVEHNTLVGLGQGFGFGATSWHPKQRFRYNIIANCDRQVEIYVPKEGPERDIHHNCYWSSSRSDLKTVGANDILADPKFVWPQWKDYRLANDSPCVKLADEAGPCGAFGVVGSAPLDLGPPRRWHVSETGRDGRDGSAGQPVRTVQFAVDRAKPGDTIILHPGFYPDPVRITRGGTKDRPLVIRAAEPWQAVLDSNRGAPVMIGIHGAPHVEIHGLEIRWYGRVAIEIDESPHATVTGCRIWNAHFLRLRHRRVVERTAGQSQQLALPTHAQPAAVLGDQRPLGLSRTGQLFFSTTPAPSSAARSARTTPPPGPPPVSPDSAPRIPPGHAPGAFASTVEPGWGGSQTGSPTRSPSSVLALPPRPLAPCIPARADSASYPSFPPGNLFLALLGPVLSHRLNSLFGAGPVFGVHLSQIA